MPSSEHEHIDIMIMKEISRYVPRWQWRGRWDAVRNTFLRDGVQGAHRCTCQPSLHHLNAPLPSPGRPRQPQARLPYGGTGDAILLGPPRTHYESDQLSCHFLHSLRSPSILRSLSSASSYLSYSHCVVGGASRNCSLAGYIRAVQY
jgi:hypothetical protein